MSPRSQQIEAITNSLAEPIAEAIALNSPQGADIADVMADVRENVYQHLSSISEGKQMTQIVAPREPKTPSVEQAKVFQPGDRVELRTGGWVDENDEVAPVIWMPGMVVANERLERDNAIQHRIITDDGVEWSVRHGISDLRAEATYSAKPEGKEMTQLVVPREPKKPSVDMIGTYLVPEPVQRVNPKDGQTYEVPRGEFPVMGLISADRKTVSAAAIILSAPNPQSGELMDIVEKIRPIDVPAMVQRHEITMETKQDNTLKFPLSMFTRNDPKQKKAQTQAPEAPEHRMRIARSA